jgi:hypothetical protein
VRFPRIYAFVVLLATLALPVCGHAYSLLTHEQLIDLTWQDSIVPLLRSHYPNLTDAQLERARAYAYGGCVIQDIGYYPFGDRPFSNLTHYVRTGDFVVSLFRNAHTANELAFAIGALSHYVGDTIGHSDAVNVAVPVEFPKLRAKYGSEVNYAEGKRQHVQVEFAFDIDEIAHHRMAPLHYLRHIGLQVSMRQLALAYYQTYGITDDFSKFKGKRVNVPGYRFATRAFIPRIAYALTLLHRKHEPAEPASEERTAFDNEVTAMASTENWQAYRRRAGIGTYMLAGIIFIVPKVGPLKLVALKGPTEETEAEYLHSVVLSVAELRRRLKRFTPPINIRASLPSPLRSSSSHPLPNRDLDTGRVVQPGGYPLTDSTYALLLHLLTQTPTQAIPPGIKQDVQAYYSNPEAPISTKKDPAAWAQVQADLATLATMPTSTEPEPYPTYGSDAAEGSE